MADVGSAAIDCSLRVAGKRRPFREAFTAVSFHLSLSTDRVAAAFPDQPLAVSSTATVGEVLQIMRAEKGKCVVVCDDGPVAGIFTERDALRCMAGELRLEAPITEFMTAKPCCVTADATVGDVIEQMSQGGYRNLPIVDQQGRLTGVAAVTGIVHYLVGYFPDTIYNLPPEPGKAPASREGA